MNTRSRIIIVVIIIAATVFFGTYQSIMYQCGTLPIYMETSKNPDLWDCLEILENQSVPPPINLSAEKDTDIYFVTDPQLFFKLTINMTE